MGNLYRYQDDYDQAQHFYKESLKVHYEHGLEPDIQYLHCLILTALHRNDYRLAYQRIIDYYHSAQKLGEKTSALGLFIGLAAVAAGMNQPERAARLSGMAEAILEMIGFRYEPIDRAEFERHIRSARDHLGEQRFEALASEGRAVTMEQAIEYALELARSL